MSADLTELCKAHKVAREDLVLTTNALENGIAERLKDALAILCECHGCSLELASDLSGALDKILSDVRSIQCELTDADPGDAERSEVADD